MTAALIELPPSPRRLRRRPGVGMGPLVLRWVIRAFIMPHCVIGVGLILMTLYIPFIVMFGIDVPGVVTKLNMSYSGKGGRSYHVYFSYAVDGTDHSESDTVNAEEYAATKVGQPCLVRVLQVLPETLPQRRTARSLWRPVGKYFLIGLFWNAILFVFVWIAWIMPWRTRRLLKYGMPVAGQIKSKTAIRGNKGNVSYQVRYVYAPSTDDQTDEAAGQLLDGQTYVSAKDFPAVAEGNVVTVLFDPRKPKRSLLYDFAEYQAIE